MKCEEQVPALFVFVVSLGVSWAAGPCCQEGETLTAEDNCLSSTTLDLTTPALTASCQGRLHQISAERFEMTKFGGLLYDQSVVVPSAHFCTSPDVVLVCDTCLYGDCIQVGQHVLPPPPD